MLFQTCKIIVVSVLAFAFIPTTAVSQQITVKKFVDEIRSQFVEALSKPGENPIELLVDEIQFKLQVVYEIGADGKIQLYVVSVGSNVKSQTIQEITFTARIAGGPIRVEAPSESQRLYAFEKEGGSLGWGLVANLPRRVPAAVVPSAIPTRRVPAAAAPSRPIPSLPLIVIRFDTPNEPYKEALRSAILSALKRRPDARFEVVALSPRKPDKAESLAALARSKRRAEEVILKLRKLGVPTDRISQSTIFDPLTQSSQIYVFAR